MKQKFIISLFDKEKIVNNQYSWIEAFEVKTSYNKTKKIININGRTMTSATPFYKFDLGTFSDVTFDSLYDYKVFVLDKFLEHYCKTFNRTIDELESRVKY